MTSDTLPSYSGRAAAMSRRRALSQGKAGLSSASERVRSGPRQAILPPASEVEVIAPASPAVALDSAAPSGVAVFEAAPPAGVPVGREPVGREAAKSRRKLLSLGKGALAAATSPPDAAAPVAAADRAGGGTDARDTARLPAESSCRELGRERRSTRSRYGRDDAPAAGPSWPPRQGELSYPAKVPSATTAAGSKFTGLSLAAGRLVTGADAGRDMPVSGTGYLGPGEGGFRQGNASKVGLGRTAGGLTVSGAMVRSKARTTGDEAGEHIRITGEADQRLADDLTERPDGGVPVSAQFQRHSQPHGQSVFGSNFGRSVRSVGWSKRYGGHQRPIEVTESGLAISGTAIGRSSRVTGDERGAWRALTGTQYLAAGSTMEASVGEGEGVFPQEPAHPGRLDPVTGAKVTEGRTWGGQRVTGPELEHNLRVTGDEAGICAHLTGTPYLGASGKYGWCDPEVAEREAECRDQRPHRQVTGDVPLADPDRVSGLRRGAGRAIGGTPYYVTEAEPADDGDPLEKSIGSFSVRSPQRMAQLANRGRRAQGHHVTGAFAMSEDKVSGNVEFDFRERFAGGSGLAEGRRRRLTGEGSVDGPPITGSAWTEDARVTGTEGYIAAGRNPSERRGQARAFAGVSAFKGQKRHEEPRRLVTGAIGWTPKSAAVVTLSGGAQG